MTSKRRAAAIALALVALAVGGFLVALLALYGCARDEEAPTGLASRPALLATTSTTYTLSIGAPDLPQYQWTSYELAPSLEIRLAPGLHWIRLYAKTAAGGPAIRSAPLAIELDTWQQCAPPAPRDAGAPLRMTYSPDPAAVFPAARRDETQGYTPSLTYIPGGWSLRFEVYDTTAGAYLDASPAVLLTADAGVGAGPKDPQIQAPEPR